jgi:uncharacterized membrane protein
MTRQTRSIVIDRPPQVVYDYMDDVAREREWQPNLRVAKQDPPGPSRQGTRKRYVSDFMGRKVENTYVVVEVDPGRRMVTETTRGSAIDARSEVTWEPEGPGTRVTMTIDGKPKGALRFIPAALLEAAYDKELETTLKRLKERIEGG